MASSIMHKIPMDGGSVYKTPRSILLISIFALVALISVYLHRDYVTQMWNEVYYGLLFTSIIVFALGALTLPSAFRRFEWFWGGCMALTAIYFAFILYSILVPLPQLRQFMQYFGAAVTRPIDRSYAEACDFTYENVVGSLDIFIVGHSVGWFFKMLVFRDFKFTFLSSAAWEVVEILFTHDLPNFAECWWDQWILDVMLCNLFGICVAWVLIPLFGMRRFDWFASVFNYVDFDGKVTGPRSSKKEIITGGIVFVVAFFWNQLFELNSFYVKALLWLPVVCPFNIIRLVLWTFVGNTTINQVYRWAFDTRPSLGIYGTSTFGSYSIYGIIMISAEVWMYLQHYSQEFPTPMPEYVVQYWMYIAAFFVIMSILFLIKVWKHTSSQAKGNFLKHGQSQPILPVLEAFSGSDRETQLQRMASKASFEDLEVSEILPKSSATHRSAVTKNQLKTPSSSSLGKGLGNGTSTGSINVIVGMSPSVHATPTSPSPNMDFMMPKSSSSDNFETPGLSGAVTRAPLSTRRAISQTQPTTESAQPAIIPRYTRGSLGLAAEQTHQHQPATIGSRDFVRATSGSRRESIKQISSSRTQSQERTRTRSSSREPDSLRMRQSHPKNQTTQSASKTNTPHAAWL